MVTKTLHEKHLRQEGGDVYYPCLGTKAGCSIFVRSEAAVRDSLRNRIKGLASIRQKCKVHNNKGNGVLEFFRDAVSFSPNCRGEKEPAFLQIRRKEESMEHQNIMEFWYPGLYDTAGN
jgi:hypothetical protein